MRNKRKKILVLSVIIILSYWPVKPLLNNFYFPMHDDTQIGRVIAMGKALRNGQFPVRWVKDLGYDYGYPIFNFYGPLPYYFGGAFYALGVDAVLATKLMFAIGILGAGLSLYFLATQMMGVVPAILASVLYLYAPYHAVQIYVRGAVGEYWTLIFLPLLFYGILPFKKNFNKSLMIGTIGLFGIITSHTLLGYAVVLFLIFTLVLLVILTLYKHSSLNLLKYFLIIFLLGLSLSAFFWLPAIFEMKSTSVVGQIGTGANYLDHYVCPDQLWNSLWGFGGSGKGCIDGMSFKLGKVHLLLSIASLGILFFSKKNLATRKSLIVILVVTLFSIFLATEYSAPVWKLLPNFAYLQYPWRFLAFSLFGMAILSGNLLYAIKNNSIKTVTLIILVIGTIYINQKLFNPQFLYFKPTVEFESGENLHFKVSQISDEFLPQEFIRPKKLSDLPHNIIDAQPATQIDLEIDTETYIKANFTNREEIDVLVNQAYFNGWVYFLDGKTIKPIILNGLPNLKIESGYHVFEMRLYNTNIRNIANMISIVGLLFLLTLYGKKTYA